jgi:hypothetical protein
MRLAGRLMDQQSGRRKDAVVHLQRMNSRQTQAL